MPTLHTVNKSPFERNSLDSCLSLCKPDGSILLIEDAVVGAMQNTSISNHIIDALKSGIRVYALREDLAARGLPTSRVIDQIGIIDYAGFVTLTVENARVQSWL
ncbi:MAG: tRNA 2-thiouridine synthesizing protein B [Gammaproteobacteria bacterium]|jgi:tRNA 2-thiouridine synthesizing protein B